MKSAYEEGSRTHVQSMVIKRVWLSQDDSPKDDYIFDGVTNPKCTYQSHLDSMSPIEETLNL